MKWFIVIALYILFHSSMQAQQRSAIPPVRLIDSIAALPVSDQGGAPICWVFGSNSLFEADLLKKRNIQVNFSKLFFVRHTYIDKAEHFLAAKGHIFIDGGGQLHDLIRVIKKHGIVPEEAYPFRYLNSFPSVPSGGGAEMDSMIMQLIKENKSTNQSRLDAAMDKTIKEFLAQGKTSLNAKDKKQLNDTLDKYCGRLSKTFLYNNKRYTAKRFAKKVVHFKNDYAEIISFPDLPLYKMSVLKDTFNWAGDSFYNVTLSDMKMLADTALSKGWSVGWEGDISEKGFAVYSGYASFDSVPANIEQQRVTDFKGLKTERDHMMHITGDGVDSTGKKWYYVKNSWGDSNPFKGYLFMNENYFNYKTVILYVNKEGLPQELRKKLGI